MPYTPSQNRLFQAAAHNKKIAEQRGLSQEKAGEMANEGVKSNGGIKKPGKGVGVVVKSLMAKKGTRQKRY